ncbi:MAG: hypothetical protein RPU32_15205, partial [Candidatus Sedimenticola sp. (ex Thyasira tokunagai)]
DSGMVNTYSGKTGKVFTLNQNECSRSAGIGVHVGPEWVFMMGRNMHRKRVLIVGNRLGMSFKMPEPTLKIEGQIFRNSDITLHHAISGLPRPSKDSKTLLQYESEEKDDFEKILRNGAKVVDDHYSPKLNDLQLARITALKPGQTMKDLPEQLQHKSFKERANRRVSDGTPTEKRGGPPSGLKRLIANEPCLTITGAATREFTYRWGQTRLILSV